jgi:hypothetical protein
VADVKVHHFLEARRIEAEIVFERRDGRLHDALQRDRWLTGGYGDSGRHYVIKNGRHFFFPLVIGAPWLPALSWLQRSNFIA